MSPTFSTPSTKTAYADHINNWLPCVRCEIGSCNETRIFARGTLPCNILILGEAPGDVEACLGEPFVGPAGQELDRLITAAFPNDLPTIALTNTIICLPAETDTLKLRAPTKGEMINCSERLDEFIELADPNVIVCAGRKAEQAIKATLYYQDFPSYVFQMPHPSSIIRQAERGGADRQRCIQTLRKAWEQCNSDE